MIHPYNYVSAKEALSIIESNTRVFIHGSMCTPTYLLAELTKEAERLTKRRNGFYFLKR